MYINQIFELSMTLENEKFQRILTKAFSDKQIECSKRNETEYIDQSLADRGIVVMYRDSQYKKKIKLIINLGLTCNCDKNVPDKWIRKVDKKIGLYFNGKYSINDFQLSKMVLVTDIDVVSCERVTAYLKVMNKIGKVKGYSMTKSEYLDKHNYFGLVGNSNGIEFSVYNLKEIIRLSQKKMDSVIKAASIIRVEVGVVKPKAIQTYLNSTGMQDCLVELLQKRQDIFLDIFTKIIPFGNFYKMDKAVEIVRKEVKNIVLRRKMLRLLMLIPEKKSLYLAQKTMSCSRDMNKIMEEFANINLSPVTLSKRQDVKQLDNIYKWMA